jgi:hypothetical protein
VRQYQSARYHWYACVHLGSRSLFFDAMINGPIKRHFIFSLNVDTDAINPGWPVDVNATATCNGMTFTSSMQNQRAALELVNGIVYVPYSDTSAIAGLITAGLSACQSTILPV